MKNIIIAIVGLLILGGIGFWYIQKDNAEVVDTTANKTEDTSGVNVSTGTSSLNAGATTSVQVMGIPEPGVTVYTVTASSFSFSPGTITVNKGDKVRIIFKNTEGNHDFVLDEFKARSKVIRGAGDDIVEFTADKIGTFEYYCSVGNHRALGMKGSFIVK